MYIWLKVASNGNKCYNSKLVEVSKLKLVGSVKLRCVKAPKSNFEFIFSSDKNCFTSFLIILISGLSSIYSMFLKVGSASAS